MTIFNITSRAVCRRVALVLLTFFVLSFAVVDSTFAQPSRDRGARSNRNNNNNDGGNGDRRNGRRDRGDQNGEGQNGGPGWGGPGWGAPGGFPGGGMPGGPGGMPGGEQGQPGEQGDGQTGGNQAPKAERKVDLDEALDKTIGTSPITLNQNNFRTRDGMQMVGTYYKGKGDKDTPVVIVLPDLESTRDSEPMTKLAVSLASEGYAVLIPDLRGRGESKSAMPNFPGMPNNDRNGQNAGASVNPNDVRMMISSDRELWFEFLIYVHNKGLCNVKKTIIVGSQFSAALASAWAKNDWTGKGDMYQNVIGLVLISPDAVDKKKKSRKRDDEEEAEPSEPTYDSLASLESVRSRAKGKGVFGYFVIVGAYNEEKKEAAQLIQRKIGGKADEEETNPANKTVMLLALETEKQGDVLYTYETFNLNKLVGQFVAKRVKELPMKRAKWEEIEAPRGR